MPQTIASDVPESRKGLTWPKILRFLSLPFFPDRLWTYLAVQRFEDIDPNRLIADGVEGLLVDADGTLGPNEAQNYPEAVVNHVRLCQEKGLNLAIFTNAGENRFSQFDGVPVVKEVYAKPDRRGFESALKNYLPATRPQNVCMVGDNFLTDGGAVLAGMRFIYVAPLPGNENAFHRSTRKLAYLCARWYHPDVFRNK